jgi:hypothetical protein
MPLRKDANNDGGSYGTFICLSCVRASRVLSRILAGDVYMWGRVTDQEDQQPRKSHQLQGALRNGIPAHWQPASNNICPLFPSSGTKISSIASGYGHVVVVSSSGSVVSFARESLRSCFAGLSLPVAAVALGSDHALLLGKDGKFPPRAQPGTAPPHTPPPCQAYATLSAATNSGSWGAHPATPTPTPSQCAAYLPLPL